MLAAKENSTFFYVGIIAEKMFRSIEKRYIRSGTVLRWTRPGDHAAPATTTPDNWNADPVNTPVETVPTHPCPRSVDARPSAVSHGKASSNEPPFLDFRRNPHRFLNHYKIIHNKYFCNSYYYLFRYFLEFIEIIIISNLWVWLKETKVNS